MIRYRLSGLFCFVLLSSVAVAQDPQSDPTPKKEESVKKEPKKETAKPPSPEEMRKKVEQIIQNAQEAGKRLADKDPGDATRTLQKENVRLIDELIHQAQNPPPNDNQQPPPKGGKDGGGGMSGMDGMGGGGSSQKTARQERKDRRERSELSRTAANGGANQPMPQTRPESKNQGGEMSGQPNPFDRRPSGSRLPDPYKEVWGHLPEKMRQEMDLYYREQFIPRYAELLRQYYSSIAEQDRPRK